MGKVSRNVRQLVAESNKTLVRIAYDAGLSKCTVSTACNMGKGRRRVSLDALARIAEALDVPTSCLLEGCDYAI